MLRQQCHWYWHQLLITAGKLCYPQYSVPEEPPFLDSEVCFMRLGRVIFAKVFRIVVLSLVVGAAIAVLAQDVPRQTVAVAYPLDELIVVKFRGTTLLPRLKGEAKVKRTSRKGTTVNLSIENMPRASE